MEGSSGFTSSMARDSKEPNRAPPDYERWRNPGIEVPTHVSPIQQLRPSTPSASSAPLNLSAASSSRGSNGTGGREQPAGLRFAQAIDTGPRYTYASPPRYPILESSQFYQPTRGQIRALGSPSQDRQREFMPVLPSPPMSVNDSSRFRHPATGLAGTAPHLPDHNPRLMCVSPQSQTFPVASPTCSNSYLTAAAMLVQKTARVNRVHDLEFNPAVLIPHLILRGMRPPTSPKVAPSSSPRVEPPSAAGVEPPSTPRVESPSTPTEASLRLPDDMLLSRQLNTRFRAPCSTRPGHNSKRGPRMKTPRLQQSHVADLPPRPTQSDRRSLPEEQAIRGVLNGAQVPSTVAPVPSALPMSSSRTSPDAPRAPWQPNTVRSVPGAAQISFAGPASNTASISTPGVISVPWPQAVQSTTLQQPPASRQSVIVSHAPGGAQISMVTSRSADTPSPPSSRNSQVVPNVEKTPGRPNVIRVPRRTQMAPRQPGPIVAPSPDSRRSKVPDEANLPQRLQQSDEDKLWQEQMLKNIPAPLAARLLSVARERNVATSTPSRNSPNLLLVRRPRREKQQPESQALQRVPASVSTANVGDPVIPVPPGRNDASATSSATTSNIRRATTTEEEPYREGSSRGKQSPWKQQPAPEQRFHSGSTNARDLAIQQRPTDTSRAVPDLTTRQTLSPISTPAWDTFQREPPVTPLIGLLTLLRQLAQGSENPQLGESGPSHRDQGRNHEEGRRDSTTRKRPQDHLYLQDESEKKLQKKEHPKDKRPTNNPQNSDLSTSGDQEHRLLRLQEQSAEQDQNGSVTPKRSRLDLPSPPPRPSAPSVAHGRLACSPGQQSMNLTHQKLPENLDGEGETKILDSTAGLNDHGVGPRARHPEENGNGDPSNGASKRDSGDSEARAPRETSAHGETREENQELCSIREIAPQAMPQRQTKRKEKSKSRKEKAEKPKTSKGSRQQWVRPEDRHHEAGTSRESSDLRYRSVFEEAFKVLKDAREGNDRSDRRENRSKAKSSDDRESPDSDEEREREKERQRKVAALIPPLDDDHHSEDSHATESNLVEDWGHENQDHFTDWTADECATFTKAYMKNPKRFDKIAAALPGKTSQKCVRFYYFWKHNESHRKQVKKLNKVLRSRGKRKTQELPSPKKQLPPATECHLCQKRLKTPAERKGSIALTKVNCESFGVSLDLLHQQNVRVCVKCRIKRSKKSLTCPMPDCGKRARRLLSIPTAWDQVDEENAVEECCETCFDQLERDNADNWDVRELRKLIEAVQKFGTDWAKVASVVGTRSKRACEIRHRKNLLALDTIDQDEQPGGSGEPDSGSGSEESTSEEYERPEELIVFHEMTKSDEMTRSESPEITNGTESWQQRTTEVAAEIEQDTKTEGDKGVFIGNHDAEQRTPLTDPDEVLQMRNVSMASDVGYQREERGSDSEYRGVCEDDEREEGELADTSSLDELVQKHQNRVGQRGREANEATRERTRQPRHSVNTGREPFESPKNPRSLTNKHSPRRHSTPISRKRSLKQMDRGDNRRTRKSPPQVEIRREPTSNVDETTRRTQAVTRSTEGARQCTDGMTWNTKEEYLGEGRRRRHVTLPDKVYRGEVKHENEDISETDPRTQEPHSGHLDSGLRAESSGSRLKAAEHEQLERHCNGLLEETSGDSDESVGRLVIDLDYRSSSSGNCSQSEAGRAISVEERRPRKEVSFEHLTPDEESHVSSYGGEQPSSSRVRTTPRSPRSDGTYNRMETSPSGENRSPSQVCQGLLLESNREDALPGQKRPSTKCSAISEHSRDFSSDVPHFDQISSDDDTDPRETKRERPSHEDTAPSFRMRSSRESNSGPPAGGTEELEENPANLSSLSRDISVQSDRGNDAEESEGVVPSFESPNGASGASPQPIDPEQCRLLQMSDEPEPLDLSYKPNESEENSEKPNLAPQSISYTIIR